MTMDLMISYGRWLRSMAGVVATVATVGGHAATVTFSDFSTATEKFGAASQIDDTLSIDVSEFTLSTSPQLDSGVTFDTIAFLVTANPGYYITSIKYTEGGSALTGESSFAGATATWVVNGAAFSLGSHLYGPNGGGGFTFDSSPRPVANLTSFLVSITNNLFAFGPDAQVSKNLALVEVTTTPIPEPSALLFLLAGLGLVVWVRRGRPA